MTYEEDLCRQALDLLLKERGFSSEWMEGSEPPDWFVKVGERRLAVEATSIHGFTDLDGKSHSWTGISKELLSFGNSVCSEVVSNTSVPGTYFVSFPAIPNLTQWRVIIVEALTEYFQTGALKVEGIEPQVVLQPSGRDLTVWKVSDEGNVLAVQALPTGAFVSRRDDQLTGLLASAVRTKAQKLKNIVEPVILVILDRYGFQSSVDEWRNRLPDEKSFFEAIVRVQAQGKKADLISGVLPGS